MLAGLNFLTKLFSNMTKKKTEQKSNYLNNEKNF